MAATTNSDSATGTARRVSSDFLLSTHSEDRHGQTVLLVLNYDLPQCTARLWTAASFHICADGGANRLYDLLPSLFPCEKPADVRCRFVPDIIKGDLDSIRPEVRSFYLERGVKVVDESHDQDSTDLEKCLRHIEDRPATDEAAQPVILAIGAMGGRLDHTLSNLNSLLRNPQLDLVLIGEANLARLLPAGRSLIRPAPGIEGPNCALMPLAGPAVATSTGLRWNLENTRMAFGGLVSSSNQLDAAEVTVETDVPLIWTTEFTDEA